MSTPLKGSNEKTKYGKFSNSALARINSEVDKYKTDLHLKSESIRNHEHPGIDINKEHVEKAITSINKEHVLEALNEYFQTKILIIFILIIIDILLKSYVKIFFLLNSGVQFMIVYSEIFTVIAFITTVPSAAYHLYVIFSSKTGKNDS